MNSEVIVEEGIVVSVDKGIANIAVVQSESCNECSAKIICKPKHANENIVSAIDSIGVKPGNRVRFEVKGGALLSASFTLYGIPLIIMIVGILLGMSIFSSFKGKELFAFLFGVSLTVVYFFLNFFKSKTINKESMPVILSIIKDHQ